MNAAEAKRLYVEYHIRQYEEGKKLIVLEREDLNQKIKEAASSGKLVLKYDAKHLSPEKKKLLYQNLMEDKYSFETMADDDFWIIRW